MIGSTSVEQRRFKVTASRELDQVDPRGEHGAIDGQHGVSDALNLVGDLRERGAPEEVMHGFRSNSDALNVTQLTAISSP